MFQLSKIARFILPALTLGVVASTSAAQQTPAPLTLKVYNADGNSFHVNAVVISGKTEAIVIDSGFTRADALRVAANVLDSGKTLKTIFISNADPDFYFGAEVLKSHFPQAQVLTTPAVREKSQAKLNGKVAFWAPKMGANAPPMLMASRTIRYITNRKTGSPRKRLRTILSTAVVKRLGSAVRVLLTTSQMAAMHW